MNKDVAYIFIAIIILVVLAVLALIINLFKDDLFNLDKVAQFKRRNKMSNKEKVRAFIIGIILILGIFGAERIYNTERIKNRRASCLKSRNHRANCRAAPCL